MIKFSIIMPSYLGGYTGAANDREDKLIRSIESVIKQTYNRWELIIIADGCDRTCEILQNYLKQYKDKYNIRLYLVPKQKLWAGVRNYGINKAKGEYIIYLDIDDYYKEDYLQLLSKEITDHDWYFVNDFKLKGNQFIEDHCSISLGSCGTSNIIHKSSLKTRWNKSDYAEDFNFIRILNKESNYFKRLNVVGYYVCHIPNTYDI